MEVYYYMSKDDYESETVGDEVIICYCCGDRAFIHMSRECMICEGGKRVCYRCLDHHEEEHKMWGDTEDDDEYGIWKPFI